MTTIKEFINAFENIDEYYICVVCSDKLHCFTFCYDEVVPEYVENLVIGRFYITNTKICFTEDDDLEGNYVTEYYLNIVPEKDFTFEKMKELDPNEEYIRWIGLV